MTQLSELKRVWQESAAESTIVGCSKEEVRMLLQSRHADLKKQVLQRLSTEIKTYLLIGLFSLCALVIEGFSSGRVVLLGASALLVMAPALGALAYKEYRLRTLPMSGTLRESTSALIQAVDSTARLYLSAYAVSIALSVAVIEILLISDRGWSFLTITFVLAGAAFVAWSYFGGRRYAARMFRSYRSELVNVLKELESL